MPLNNRLTNPGRPLTSEYLGGESDTIREIPPEFRAALDLTVVEIPLPWDQGPIPLSDTVLASKCEQKFTADRTRRTTTKPPGNVTLLEKFTNARKQLGNRTRIFHPMSDYPGAVHLASATIDVKTQNLGNQHYIEDVEDSINLFSNIVYETAIPNLIPPEMRAAIPEVTIEQTLTGLASPPTLGTGDLSARDEQVTVYTHRAKSTNMAAGSLPRVLTGKENTEEYGGGVLNIVRTLANSGLTTDTGLLVVASKVNPLGNGLDYKESRILSTAAWPTLTSKVWDEEMQVLAQIDTQVVDPTYTPLTGTYFVEEIKAIDVWRVQRVRKTRTPTAVDAGSAITTYEYRPYQFPGLLDYARLTIYDHHEGYRKVSAQLCKHTIKTWWQTGGSAPSIAVDEIILDTVNVPIFTTGNTTLAQEYPNVLHDTFNNSLGAAYPATTPSLTAYALGTVSGTHTANFASPYASGTGYGVGNSLTISDGSGHSITITVTAVGGSGEITNWSVGSGNYPVGTFGPFAATGGSGTGAQFNVVGYTVTDYTPGTAWIGQLKIISAKVEKTNIPNLWKCTTVSVVMR